MQALRSASRALLLLALLCCAGEVGSQSSSPITTTGPGPTTAPSTPVAATTPAPQQTSQVDSAFQKRSESVSLGIALALGTTVMLAVFILIFKSFRRSARYTSLGRHLYGTPPHKSSTPEMTPSEFSFESDLESQPSSPAPDTPSKPKAEAKPGHKRSHPRSKHPDRNPKRKRAAPTATPSPSSESLLPPRLLLAPQLPPPPIYVENPSFRISRAPTPGSRGRNESVV